ncbi:hypothetical protein [Streptomyces sp. NPDC050485]|uniref:hypothetical protein n=1 Tax=Streptomyces sp. NPDC050485 TaxID=3365617 RepID=UPI00378A10C7
MTSQERRITGEAVTEAGHYPTPPITRLNAQALRLFGAEPMIAFIQPDTVAYIAESGESLAADTIEVSMQANGARRITMPPEPPTDITDGWMARLNVRTHELVIHFPSGLVFYDGTMPTAPGWHQDLPSSGSARSGNPMARRRQSVVIITGPMATAADMEPVMAAGRAHWLRIPITVTG